MGEERRLNIAKTSVFMAMRQADKQVELCIRYSGNGLIRSPAHKMAPMVQLYRNICCSQDSHTKPELALL